MATIEDEFTIVVDELEIQNPFDQKLLEDTAHAALEIIRANHEGYLEEARDPDGRKMPPLSEDYQQYKDQVRNQSGSIRDLTLTGDMLRGSSVEPEPMGAGYGFFTAGADPKASPVEKARWNQNRHRFHYLSKEDEKLAMDHFEDMLDEGLKGLVTIKRRT